MVEGEAVCARVFRGDEVGDGFGLGEVETAVEEGALSEFAWAREAAAGVDRAELDERDGELVDEEL